MASDAKSLHSNSKIHHTSNQNTSKKVQSSQLSSSGHNKSIEQVLDFAKLYAIVKKNWMVLKGDNVRLFPLLFMPLVMIIIFGYTAGNLPKHLPTAIADYDQTSFSNSISNEISALDYFSVKYHVGTQDEGKRLLDEGKIKVLFILPQGLCDKVSTNQVAQISIMVDESDSSVSQSAKSVAQLFSQSLSNSILDSRLTFISNQNMLVKSDIYNSNSALSKLSKNKDFVPLDNSASKISSHLLQTLSNSDSQISAVIISLQNSLGYLIDQNEVVDSFNPSSLGNAALAKLATGDSQASTLQEIALYKSIQGSHLLIKKDVSSLSSLLKTYDFQVQSQSSQAKTALYFEDLAQVRLDSIQYHVDNANNLVSLEILQPYGYGRRSIDFLLPAILALIVFQGAVMGLGRAVAGERQDGSLTRVFLTPTSNVTILLGTQIFYLLLETVRSTLLIFVAILLFGVSISGSIVDIIIIVALFSFGATGVGMVLSVMAKSQDQYMALSMLISMPMMFLSGAFFPIQTMPLVLQSFATVLPITYAADALRGVMVKGFTLYQIMPDLIVLIVFGVATITLSLLLFKRELV